MKLNPKCVRDVLLSLEQMSGLNDNFLPKSFNIYDFFTDDLTSKYSKEEIVYTLRKLTEADYIIASFKYASNSLYSSDIKELTYKGHEFLDTISNSQIFDSVIEKLDELGSGVSFEILKALATKLLKEKFGL